MATVRLDFLSTEEAAIRLVAVLPNYQGNNIGKQMLQSLEVYARDCGIKKLLTNAATKAIGFYKALGFIQEQWLDTGEQFSQPTVSMIKNI